MTIPKTLSRNRASTQPYRGRLSHAIKSREAYVPAAAASSASRNVTAPVRPCFFFCGGNGCRQGEQQDHSPAGKRGEIQRKAEIVPRDRHQEWQTRLGDLVYFPFKAQREGQLRYLRYFRAYPVDIEKVKKYAEQSNRCLIIWLSV
ncbi:MAG: hypothetical protein K6G90_13340 [Clostridia bacterium]|nr:hypothetical protein [Clostridia bacterium]